MFNKFKCKKCGKEAPTKDGIEGDGHPYFVSCTHCNARHKLLPAASASDGPTNFTVSQLLDDRA
jgi:transcription elongation factor Elf1